ncbi:MAG: hypothetical protein KGM24_03375 [Elusimicrobia bacterium]|nr:hypothetical protein [Elusimicrobiota bacterium]
MKRILTAAVLLGLATSARADAGLRTPFGEVVVRRLKIGQTYSLYKLVNLPLRVVNTGDVTQNLTIETIPAGANKTRLGYEPIPSLDWVKVAQSSFTLAPNREAVTDLIISIPNDPKLLGRRFEADVWSHTSSAQGAVGVGIISRLLLQIDSTPPTPDELRQKFVDERVANLDFTVLPSETDLGPVPLNRTIDLRKERHVTVKLINPNDRPLHFRVRSIPVWESLITPPQGYVAAFDPHWLKPDREVVKVDADSIGSVSFTLDIPDEPRIRGLRMYFIVSFDVLEQKIPTHVYYRLRATMPPADKTSGKTR